MYILGSNMDI